MLSVEGVEGAGSVVAVLRAGRGDEGIGLLDLRHGERCGHCYDS